MEGANAGGILPLGDNVQIVDFIDTYRLMFGAPDYDRDLYHSLEANGWLTRAVLGDPEFPTLVLPSLIVDVVDVVVPETRRPAVRWALVRASQTLAARLGNPYGPQGPGHGAAGLGGGGADGLTVAGSISSTSHTSGESSSAPRPKMGATSYVTKDGEPITVQRTAGAIDRIRANQHWLRIWSADRRAYFLGDNIEMEPEEFVDRLDTITANVQAGFPPAGTDWGSMDRLCEFRVLRVAQCPDKLTRLAAFEWDALHPLRLSITDFVADNTTFRQLDSTSVEVATRAALQRCLIGLALTLHVLTGTPYALYEAAFAGMTVALQGERSVFIPDIMLIYAINIAVGRVMATFRKDAPQAEDPDYFIKPGAFVKALDTALSISVSRLPSTSNFLEFDKFNRTVLPIILKNSRKGGVSKGEVGKVDASDGGSDTDESGAPKRSRRRGKRSKGQKRAADVDSTASAGAKRGGGAGPLSTSLGSSVSAGVGSSNASSSGTAGRGRATADPCPYHVAHQLRCRLKNDPTAFVTCKSGSGGQVCDRGSHVSLKSLTRAEALAVFDKEPVSKFWVAQQCRTLIAAEANSSFKP